MFKIPDFDTRPSWISEFERNELIDLFEKQLRDLNKKIVKLTELNTINEGIIKRMQIREQDYKTAIRCHEINLSMVKPR